MPTIKPFKALMYNPAKFRDLSKVLAPPYDVISPKDQEDLYRRSPRNITRIILGKTKPGDSSRDNKYTRALRSFRNWIKEGVLVSDRRSPAIYVCTQECGGEKRTGFVAALRVEEYGRGIFPHEDTFLSHRVDRLSLLRLCRANFNPIFFLYSPGSSALEKIFKKTVARQPLESLEFQGVKSRVWRVADPGSVSVFVREMKKKKVFIADGHHRYDVALKYSREAKGAGYTMGLFVSMEDKGLKILPTHRAIKTAVRLSSPEFLKLVNRYFRVTRFGSPGRMIACLKPGFYGFGMYAGGNIFELLEARDIRQVERLFHGDVPPCWRRLNMVILHHFFLHNILKLGEVPGENIKYVTDEAEAKKLVDTGGYSAVFFLNSIKPETVREIALSGEKMPHKATYFYPKPLSGLIIYKFP
ncbi:hypothetical protein COY52_08455 [Candidatus Desantisbacteria bacterium CG_4_10_14_0_8_um_filter_48_22]|uniref:DUF1015 domain-containing protein n=1 Tax=Candidatus Desantisbacteria bacterium CG_4_10_14_0_8_um_filter_48_22 TaxID=1974543 RepID=A0A2M7S928_9BACT|nr:MAG: hypothetical protein AUJ67_04310 [Candidatus Desantisbacteria bacterium CG1_02_49_89]PIV55700.1 MAG: hypothetical protein COS16_06320 [Candidatus Desantisbacteria bacterium CG02_land_8_20_14_3_00_49_13]PIZ15948.1 MAG: hypothetical protein COY52_08455 [Candidatus Desantisbacteria bacterium CG_4_10_14_0_8_um_filter_48_22]PJB27978.1 MAG: hypothetical protein CO111_02770 [Candidatus Desantisbacteria bacterium CG_4_9_14_3_um_filter_50_7]